MVAAIRDEGGAEELRLEPCPTGIEPERAWESRSEEDLLDELQAIVERSVRARLLSDVPLGAFLSGGIDSTLVVGAMRRAESPRPAMLEDFNELAEIAPKSPPIDGIRRERSLQGVVKVVRPRAVQMITDAREQNLLVSLVLRDDKRTAGMRGVPQFAQDVMLGTIVDRMGRIQPEGFVQVPR